MNSVNKMLGMGAIASAALASVPSVALAETPSGADLLLPKPADFIPALIAFLIIWFVLAKLAWPSILGMMEKRQQKIQEDLDAAEQSRQQAAEKVKGCEALIAKANKEAIDIVAQAKKDAEEERAKILAKAQRESTDIIAKAHGAASTERKKATIELSEQVVDLSVEIASKVIGDSMSVDQQRHLAEMYLAEVSVHDA